MASGTNGMVSKRAFTAEGLHLGRHSSCGEPARRGRGA